MLTIIQILAEAPGRDLIQQVAVRSRHDAHIHLEGGVASHALDLPLLDGPQELDLHEQGNFADFIQKQRAAVRLQKTPVPALVRARESAFLVPEQFGFQKAFGQGRTVHRHPRAVLALALVMDGPRHQLLARPGLAVDQHRRLRRGHSVDHLQHPPDGGAVSHDALHWNGKTLAGPDGLAVFQRFEQGGLELIKVEGLDEIIHGPGLHGLHSGLHGGIRRHEHDRHGGIVLADFLQSRDAVHVGHSDIHQHHVKRPFAYPRHSLFAIPRRRNGQPPAPKERLKHPAMPRIVIHHKNRMRTFLSHAIPQLILDQSNTHNPNKPFSSAFRHIMDLIKNQEKRG